MTSSILSFFEARSRTQVEPPRGWTNQELAEFYRVADSLNQAGLAVETDLGVSDEGEPWFAFYHPDSADVVAHFARIDGRFVAAGASQDEVVTGRDLREIIDRMLRTKPMLMPIGKGRGAGNLLLHPAIVLTAFVATALFAMQDAQASPLGKGGDDSHQGGAAPADKAAKSAPTLIQKLLASVESAGTSKQNTSEALNQGFQQIALQSAIAFAMAALPVGTQPVASGDLFDVSATSIAAARAAEAGTVTIESLADLSRTASTSLAVAASITAEHFVAGGGSHGAEDHAAATIAFNPTVPTPISTLVEATLAARDDAAAVVHAIRATPGLMELLRDLAQVVPQAHATAAAAAPTGDNGTAKATADAAPKVFEVTLTTDASHSTFLQSQLFKELFNVQTVAIAGADTGTASDGSVTVKVVFAPPAEQPAPAAPSDATTPPPVDTTTVHVTDAAAAAARPADTVVKTGIAIFDHIIDYSVSFAAGTPDAFAQALIAIDNANGHLLAGAKRIVLFDSHDLSLDVYRISDDVVMIDVELLHLTHAQAAAGHATATMSLPNGGTVELVGVLAPPPGLF